MAMDSTGLLDSIRRLFAPNRGEDADRTNFAVTKPAEQWREMLTPDQYRVLREHGTERPGSSPMLKEGRVGTYCCAGCGEPVYASHDKFDSGTGWPSFSAPVGDHVATSTDRGMIMSRTEVHCAKCGGHLGHRFADGPLPTGMRHCINGCALTFEPD